VIEPAWTPHLPAGQSLPVLAGDDESLASAWRARWDEEPERVALVDLTGEAEVALTRGELAQRSAAAAGVLHEAGVRPGDRVLLSGAPSVPYLLLYLGAIRLGAVIVPANTGYTRAELDHLLADSQAVLAVVDDPRRLGDAAVPALVPAAVALDAPAGAPPPSLDAARADDLAMIAYTSGTTGRPKGAMLSHRNLLASARSVTLSWRWTADDGLVLALPLFHLHGLGVGLHGSLVSGGRILLLAGFTPEGVAAAAARPDATLLFGVPTMHKRLAELAAADPAAADALRGLRLVVSGSAPLADELWQRLADVTGQRVLERYGMTETVMNISNPYEGERRAGTVGLPLPGVEVRLDGEGDSGEILLRGPNVFAGYWGRPEATAESFTDDGWFRSGDIGRRADDGYIAIVGRSKELIISGGYNVYPREVEEVLELHDGVAEAVVVGRPSAEWGERVVAFIVAADPAAPPDADALTALVTERLAAYKKPREYHLVDAVPRNALGKVERRRLTERLPADDGA
jgi:malonyl-CoA/methylmalonyl-CoA synthetase